MILKGKYQQGRRLMLGAVVLLAVTHICGYLPNSAPNNLPVNWTRIVTFIPAWVWVIAWAVTAVVAVWEMIAQRGRKAISLTVALCTATAATYLFSYIMTILNVGWGSREWFYLGLYGSFALIVSGLLTKIGALKRGGIRTDD